MIRILHTSDWHLGRWLYSFGGTVSLPLFLIGCAGVIRERQIDYLLVAGDVFDTGTPSPVAQKMYYRFWPLLPPPAAGGGHSLRAITIPLLFWRRPKNC